jgi:uncharacterized protein
MLEQKIERDLKKALLSGDGREVTLLRGLKNAILYAKVAGGTKNREMPDEETIRLLAKEAKKRQESADLYRQGGDESRAEAELAEKILIERYLPKALSEDEILKIIDQVVREEGATDLTAMGQVIGVVRQKTKGAADGATIARLVKDRLAK